MLWSRKPRTSVQARSQHSKAPSACSRGGRDGVVLQYEAYSEMAEKIIAEIAGEVKERYDLCEVAVAHRLGRVEIGETSVVIAVSAPHRQDALAACKDVIDALKERVPLWKKELLCGRRGVDRARVVEVGQASRFNARPDPLLVTLCLLVTSRARRCRLDQSR